MAIYPPVTTVRKAGDTRLYGDVQLSGGNSITLTESGQTITIASTGNTMAIGNVVTGGTSGSVLFVGADSVLAQDNDHFFWDDLNNALAIGQKDTSFNVNSIAITSKFTVDMEDDLAGMLNHTHNSTGAIASNLILAKSRGTHSSPTIVQQSDTLGILAGYGYTGNSGVGYQKAAQIRFNVSPTGTVSTTSMPGRVEFYTTPNSSVTPELALTIGSSKTATFVGDIFGDDGLNIYGGTSGTHELTLYANSQPFSFTNTGKIQFKDRLVSSFPMTGSGVIVDQVFFIDGTLTTSSTTTLYQGIVDSRIIKNSASQLVSSFSSFTANTIHSPTANGITDTACVYTGFSATNSYRPDVGGGNTAATDKLIGYSSSPRIGPIISGASATITTLNAFQSWGVNAFGTTDIAANCTGTNVIHYDCSALASSGTVVNQYFLNIPNTTVGTNIRGINSALASATDKWFIYSSGTAASTHVGKFRFGDTTAPSAQVEIITGSAATVGEVVKGSASQTADLSQWQDSAGTSHLKVIADQTVNYYATNRTITANINAFTSSSTITTAGFLPNFFTSFNTILYTAQPAFGLPPFFFSFQANIRINTAITLAQAPAMYNGPSFTADGAVWTGSDLLAAFVDTSTYNIANSGSFTGVVHNSFRSTLAIASGAAIDTRRGMLIGDCTGAGTLTNNYGLVIRNLTKGTTNIAIKQEGTTGHNRLQAMTKIGADSTPAVDMDIVGAIANGQTVVSLTADNQIVSTANRSYISLSSNNGTPANRDFVLTQSTVPGQTLVLEWTGTNAAQLIDDSAQSGGGNHRLSANWVPTQYDTLCLISNGTDWIETSRSTN